MSGNQIIHGDCLKVMCDMPENSIDAIVTDPPYGLSFMGKLWDHGVPGIPFWEAAIRVAKPGAHMLAFGGTRTHHRLMVAIEDAGWEIRDCLGWIYGSGFPKSLDVSKAIDKAAGAEREVVGRRTDRAATPKTSMKGGNLCGCGKERELIDLSAITAPSSDAAKQWNGWGTALKPAWEPIILCRKPLSEKTVAENVQKWGTGGLNIDACRIATNPKVDDPRLGGKGDWSSDKMAKNVYEGGYAGERVGSSVKGRFPANLIHDGSDEVLALFPETNGTKASLANTEPTDADSQIYGFAKYEKMHKSGAHHGDSGSAARFFYTAKADTTERNKYLKGRPLQKVNDGRDTPIDNPFQRGETLRKNIHPTVKPIDLLQYLARLITPPKGTILDPFAGSGSTGIAAFNEGFNYILIEIEKEYVDIAKVRNAQTGLPS